MHPTQFLNLEHLPYAEALDLIPHRRHFATDIAAQNFRRGDARAM